jgi:hypothetical protein
MAKTDKAPAPTAAVVLDALLKRLSAHPNPKVAAWGARLLAGDGKGVKA